MKRKGSKPRRSAPRPDEIRKLRARLEEAEETLRAIREGEVDAIVVSGSKGDRVFSLTGADSVYRLIVETMKEAALTVTADGKILFCNKQFGRLLKKPMERIVGRPLGEFVGTDQRAVVTSLLAKSQTESVTGRVMFQGTAESPIPAHVSATVLHQPDGLSVCIVATDLSELEASTEMLRQLRRQQEALTQSEQRARGEASRLQAVLDAAPAMIWVAFDRECHDIAGNRVAYEFSQMPIGTNLSKPGLAPERLAHYRVFKDGVELAPQDMPIQRVAASGKALRDYAVDFVFDDGTVRSLLGNVIPVLDTRGEPSGAIAAFVDVTERKRAEEALRRAHDELEARVNERTAQLTQAVETLSAEVERRTVAEEALWQRSLQLRALASAISLAEERERRRLAEVLHDDLQQLLVGARLQLNGLQRAPEASVTRTADEVERLINRALDVSRSLTRELSPPILREGGLIQALQWLAGWMAEKHGLQVTVTATEDVTPESDDQKVQLFQAVRELMFNVVKHAGVGAASVQVSRQEDQIQVLVEDSGAGFDPAQLTAKGVTRGFGLVNIRERLDAMGGRLEIDSAPGKGSRLTLTAPLATGGGGSRSPSAPSEKDS